MLLYNAQDPVALIYSLGLTDDSEMDVGSILFKLIGTSCIPVKSAYDALWNNQKL